VRPPRDYRPQQLYAVTQRGNQGQWVYRDTEDFETALTLMRRYSVMHDVAIHGYCLLHNHGHWILEASTQKSISCLMRDLQGRYSYYLNRKYRAQPWLLIAPLDGPIDLDSFSPYRRTGPVNWTPRYDAQFLDAAGFKGFLKYLELNPVRANLTGRAKDWKWSSAPAHCAGVNPNELLRLDRWEHIFRRPETIAVDWYRYLDEAVDVERANREWLCRLQGTGSRQNRPLAWSILAIAADVPPPGG
jgi:REP element-mobilizing transposase RayT